MSFPVYFIYNLLFLLRYQSLIVAGVASGEGTPTSTAGTGNTGKKISVSGKHGLTSDCSSVVLLA